MKGFDPKFTDLPEYILGITYEIWEQKQVDTLDHYYSPDIPVRSPSSLVVGNKAVIDATNATLAEFPDRQLLGEDVIWSGNEDDGFLSSHRIMSTATHLGDGVYGKASGQTFRYRVIADCAAINNQIFDEWLVRDQGAIVRQLGADPVQYARDQIEAEGGFASAIRPFTPDQDIDGGYHGTGNTEEHGQRYADALTAIMDGEADAIESRFDRACHLSYPGAVDGSGWKAAAEMWMGLRASFPTATFAIHHQIGRNDQGLSPRAAIRWSLTGKHDGDGSFGPPTGAPVHVMGISHAEFGPYGLRREFVLFDETAIHKQILLHVG